AISNSADVTLEPPLFSGGREFVADGPLSPVWSGEFCSWTDGALVERGRCSLVEGAATDGVATLRRTEEAETEVELLTSDVRLNLPQSRRPCSLDDELMMADCSSSGLR
ncbi:unnamed protein product, partial [Ixodes pacificus]